MAQESEFYIDSYRLIMKVMTLNLENGLGAKKEEAVCKGESLSTRNNTVLL